VADYKKTANFFIAEMYDPRNFCGGRRTEEPGEKPAEIPAEQGREPTTNSTDL